MTDRYAVFGNPVAHSKSPLIHSLFAAQTNQHIDYQRQLVDLNGFTDAATQFFADGGAGLNVTVPFKLDAYAFASTLSQRARQAGAVNTLTRGSGGAIEGDNTDGVGLLRDLHENLGWQLTGSQILVLGAGGAVRGVLGPLLESGPSQLVVANRTVGKARQLAQLFSAQGDVVAMDFAALAGRSFDIVINGTSASISGDLLPLPPTLLTTSSCCYDLMYSNEPTVFMRWANACGAATVADGLGMLVEQAAESFYIWRKFRPNTAVVIKSLRCT